MRIEQLRFKKRSINRNRNRAFRRQTKIIIAILGSICFFLFSDCAYKVAPTGGPEDKTPPEIIYTLPAPDSTNIESLPYLEFRFSEAVDKASFRNETWLLPELPGGYELKWKGSKTLRIILNDALEKDQTYIFTIGTGVQDLHRNSLPSPLVLPFSTGNEIDQGEISGRVFEKNPRGIFIYAYVISDTFSAGVVFKRKPRYYTQIGSSGDFQLRYLKEDSYRVYALEDKNGDKKYTLQTDRIGIPVKDVTISSQRMKHSQVNFYLIREDTTRPQFARADTLYKNALELSFNEPLLRDQLISISIRDSLNRSELPIIASELNFEEPNRIVLYTGPQKNVKYVGTMSAVQDTAGNISPDDTVRFSFIGALDSDTTSAKLIAVDPEDGHKDVDYDSGIELSFYYPVDSTSLMNGFQLLSPDSLPIPGKWQFESLLRPRFVPDTTLSKDATYRIRLDLLKINTIFGDAIGDSILLSGFKTKDWAQLGEIAGVVYSDNPEHKSAIIKASPLRGVGKYTTSAEVGKSYLLQFLPEGLYLLEAGIDVNQNQKMDRGGALHFQYSEPFKALPDTIKVRKRWTTEGVNFRFEQ